MMSCLLWVWNLLVAPGKYEHVPIGVHGHGRADQPGGGGHTRLGITGWGSPNSNEGTDTVVLYINKYFVVLTHVSDPYLVPLGKQGSVVLPEK
jgi:hypothetical protein